MKTYTGKGKNDAKNCCFTVYDKVRVKVDVTTEFPLDIKCTLLITEDDHVIYDELKQGPKIEFSTCEVQ